MSQSSAQRRAAEGVEWPVGPWSWGSTGQLCPRPISRIVPAGPPTHGQRLHMPFVSAPAIGKLQMVIGSVTITRANVVVAQPAVGDLVYIGDLIETGSDGLVAIVFADGTPFQLYPSARMVLDEFVCGAEKSSHSARFRVLKGAGFIAGKAATTGRLIIDAPVAQIQSTGPAAGIGSLAFTALTIGLIHELKAANADFALLNDDTINFGIYEVCTATDCYPIDDPNVTLFFQRHGSQVGVSKLANTPQQLAQFHDALLDAYAIQSLGQQWTNLQSTASNGSSTPWDQLFFQQTFQQYGNPNPINLTGSGSNSGSTSGTTTSSPTGFNLTFIWSGTGNFPQTIDWNQGAAPTDPSIDTVVVQSGKLTYDRDSHFRRPDRRPKRDSQYRRRQAHGS